MMEFVSKSRKVIGEMWQWVKANIYCNCAPSNLSFCEWNTWRHSIYWGISGRDMRWYCWLLVIVCFRPIRKELIWLIDLLPLSLFLSTPGLLVTRWQLLHLSVWCLTSPVPRFLCQIVFASFTWLSSPSFSCGPSTFFAPNYDLCLLPALAWLPSSFVCVSCPLPPHLISL